MSGTLRCEPDQLAAHAERIAEFAARIAEVASASHAPGPHAFGVVGRVFASDAIASCGRTAAAVAALADSARQHSAELRACRTGYLLADREAAGLFEGGR